MHSPAFAKKINIFGFTSLLSNFTMADASKPNYLKKSPRILMQKPWLFSYTTGSIKKRATFAVEQLKGVLA